MLLPLLESENEFHEQQQALVLSSACRQPIESSLTPNLYIVDRCSSKFAQAEFAS